MKKHLSLLLAGLALFPASADSVSADSLLLVPRIIDTSRYMDFDVKSEAVSEYTAGDATGMTVYIEENTNISPNYIMDLKDRVVSVDTDVGTFSVTLCKDTDVDDSETLSAFFGMDIKHRSNWQRIIFETIRFFPPGEYVVKFKGTATSHPPYWGDKYMDGPVYGPLNYGKEVRFRVVPSVYDLAAVLNIEDAVKKGLVSIDTKTRGTSPHGWQPAFDKEKKRLYAVNGLCGLGQSSTFTIKAHRPIRLTGRSANVSCDLTWHSTEQPQERLLKPDFQIDLEKEGSEVTFTFTRDNSPLDFARVYFPSGYITAETPNVMPHAGKKTYPKAEIYDCKVIELANIKVETIVVTNFVHEVTTEEKRYSVRLTAEGDPNAVLAGDGEYRADERVNIHAMASEGMTCDGWFQNGKRVSFSARHDFRMPEKDLEFVAKFMKQAPTYVKLFLESDDFPRKEVPTQATNLVMEVSSTICWRLVVDSNVKTTLTIDGVPQGMVFDRYNSTLMGTPQRPGEYKVNCWVRETGQSGRMHLKGFVIKANVPEPYSLFRSNGREGEAKAKPKEGEKKQAAAEEEPKKPRLRTDANEYFQEPLPNGPNDSPLRFEVREDVEAAFPKFKLKPKYVDTCRVIVTGLPRGVKVDLKKQRIVGAPARAGEYLITVTVRDQEKMTRKVSTFVVSVVNPTPQAQ